MATSVVLDYEAMSSMVGMLKSGIDGAVFSVKTMMSELEDVSKICQHKDLMKMCNNFVDYYNTRMIPVIMSKYENWLNSDINVEATLRKTGSDSQDALATARGFQQRLKYVIEEGLTQISELQHSLEYPHFNESDMEKCVGIVRSKSASITDYTSKSISDFESRSESSVLFMNVSSLAVGVFNELNGATEQINNELIKLSQATGVAIPNVVNIATQGNSMAKSQGSAAITEYTQYTPEWE